MSDLLIFNSHDLSFLLPEIILVAGILFLISLDLLLENQNKVIFIFSMAVVFLAAIGLGLNSNPATPIAFNSLFPNSSSVYLRLLADISLILILLFWNESKSKEEKNNNEYLYLWMSKLLGVHLLIISNSWLMVFLSMELISISSYILIGRGYTQKNTEAAFKYLVFGALSTGIMLFGISLFYVTKGNFYFSGSPFFYEEIKEVFELSSFAVLLIFAGIFFKLSLFPFHFWAPDAYEGTSFPIMLSLSTLPKIGTFGFLSAQFLIIWPEGVFQSSLISDYLAGIGLISIIWGNFSALGQTKISRLFAYSGIAQSGFMLLALLTGFGSILNIEIYLTLYLLMLLIVFMSAQSFNFSEDTLIENFRGLGSSHLILALSLVISMISLIGLPPSAAFTAKFMILSNVFEWYSFDSNSYRLIIFGAAVLNIIISMFYYLKIPFAMFFRKGEGQIPELSTLSKIIIYASSIFLILSFFLFDFFQDGIKYFGTDHF